MAHPVWDKAHCSLGFLPWPGGGEGGGHPAAFQGIKNPLRRPIKAYFLVRVPPSTLGSEKNLRQPSVFLFPLWGITGLFFAWLLGKQKKGGLFFWHRGPRAPCEVGKKKKFFVWPGRGPSPSTPHPPPKPPYTPPRAGAYQDFPQYYFSRLFFGVPSAFCLRGNPRGWQNGSLRKVGGFPTGTALGTKGEISTDFCFLTPRPKNGLEFWAGGGRRGYKSSPKGSVTNQKKKKKKIWPGNLFHQRAGTIPLNPKTPFLKSFSLSPVSFFSSGTENFSKYFVGGPGKNAGGPKTKRPNWVCCSVWNWGVVFGG